MSEESLKPGRMGRGATSPESLSATTLGAAADAGTLVRDLGLQSRRPVKPPLRPAQIAAPGDVPATHSFGSGRERRRGDQEHLVFSSARRPVTSPALPEASCGVSYDGGD